MIFFTSFVLAAITATSIVFASGIPVMISNYAVGLVWFFIFYWFNWFYYRTFSLIVNAVGAGTFTDKLLHDLYRCFFSVFYIFWVLYLPTIVDCSKQDSLLQLGGFTKTSFNEVILLAVLLFLALVSYRRCATDAIMRTNEFINSTVKAAMLLFLTYAGVLIYPCLSFANLETFIIFLLSPNEYFASYKLVDMFMTQSNSVYIISTKLLFLLFANFQMHLVKRYYMNFFISHNFFVIMLLLIWLNLLVIGLDQLFIIFFTFDAISLVTTAFIILHEKPTSNTHTPIALFYVLLSILTSACAYFGYFLIYVFHQNSSLLSCFILYESGKDIVGAGFMAFGWFLITIKLMFLLGAFPFYKYVLDIGSIIFFPSIFYWSALSKLPVIFFIAKFISLSYYVHEQFFSIFWQTMLACSILYGSVALCFSPKLKVFFAFSSMINIATIVLFATLAWKSSVFVILISFTLYAFAMFGILLYLSSPRRLTPYAFARGMGEVDVFEDLIWSSQEITFSRDINGRYNIRGVFSFIVKSSAGISVLVLMGVAPFSGFLMKFLVVSAFSSISSFFICFIILVATVFAHLGYFYTYVRFNERVPAAANLSFKEWGMFIDEDDMMYFQYVFIFSFYSIIFCLSLIF